MASSAFFRFKSQKESTRVTFDGTGISVFELKREIIAISHLGDGTDFELTLSSPDSNEEYDDDTTIIPRSTTVIARRLPAAKPGKGGSSRYVSGKAPVNAKTKSDAMKPPSGGPAPGSANIADLQTEEERMAAILQMGADQWQQQKAQMANATPVFRPGGRGKPVTVPDHPPPAGYTCHRCQQKGHWIQACPTNDDPTFEGRPRIKRTTGIPKSFLRTIEKPTAGVDGDDDDQKAPSGVMMNAEGEYVVAEPDKAAWEQYQAKANRSAMAQQEAAIGSKELQDRGLECSVDKRMFVDPVKTPCCQKTYCNECITNALLDNNLECPNCGKDEISIDDLAPDDELVAKIRSYQEEKAKATAEKLQTTEEKQGVTDEQSQSSAGKKEGSRSRSSSKSSNPKSEAGSSVGTPGSKKRKADDTLESDRKTPNPASDNAANKAFSKPPPTGPKADAQKGPQFPPELAFMNQPLNMMPNMMPNINMFPNMASMPNMPNMPMNMSGMGMNMNGMGANMNGMGMNMNMMQANPMWNSMNNGMPNQWAGMNNMMPNQPNNAYGMNGNGGMTNQPNNAHGMQGNGGTNQESKNDQANAHKKRKGNNMNGRGGFQGQHRNFNSRPATNDSPYFRQPVNPQRHQGRRNIQRPADYREI